MDNGTELTDIYDIDKETYLEFQVRMQREEEIRNIGVDSTPPTEIESYIDFSRSLAFARLAKLNIETAVAVPVAQVCPNPTGCLTIRENIHITYFEQDVKWRRETQTPFDMMNMMNKRLRKQLGAQVVRAFYGKRQGTPEVLPEHEVNKWVESGSNRDTWTPTVGDWVVKLSTIYDPPTTVKAMDDMAKKGITRDDFHHAELVWWLETPKSLEYGLRIKMILHFDPNKLEQLFGANIRFAMGKQFKVTLPHKTKYSAIRYAGGHTYFYQHTAQEY